MHRLFQTIGYVGAALIAGLTLLTGSDIAGRYLFNSPILGTYELTNVTLAIIGSLGIALSTAAEEHIAVDVLYERLPSSGRRALRLGANVIGVVIFGVLAWQNTLSFLRSISTAYEVTDLLHVPMYPFRLVLVLGFLISLVTLLCQIAGLPRWKPEAEGHREKAV
jgi:TRAP-type C4-dicarboxylate transport system permease small subunit